MSTTVNCSVPVFEESATNVAVIVTGEAGTAVGATYAAVAGVVEGVTGVSVPHGFGVPVQAVPLRLQVTDVFAELDTLAVSVTDCVG
jgi:hypothetical protein